MKKQDKTDTKRTPFEKKLIEQANKYEQVSE